MFGFSSAVLAAPSYVTAGTENIVVCGNGTFNLSSYLKINDVGNLPGQTETWSASAPGYGTVTGTFTANLSPTFDAQPSLIYTPSVGSGVDFFTVTVSDGTNPPVSKSFNVTIQAVPTLTMGTFPAVCRGVTTAALTYSGLQNAGPASVTYNYVAPGGLQTFTVPAGVTSVSFDVAGGSGGRDNYSTPAIPGKGGRVQGTLAVNPGNVLNIFVGGKGGDGTATGAVGGYNGGANAMFYSFASGGAGGGASDIRLGGTGLGNRVVVAGGAGGSGWNDAAVAGGHGGTTSGGNSGNNLSGNYASGGSQFVGGAPATYPTYVPASAGSFGNGGAPSIQGISGGGGGGYYGGGGGLWSGGGGGSSYTDAGIATSVTHTQGYNVGDGLVKLNYILPSTYSITWDGAAAAAGFTNVTGAAMPNTSPITISVPATAPAGPLGTIYHGNMTITNTGTGCTSALIPIQITINPIPDVNVTSIPDQILCNGSSTVDINPSGSITASFDWTNDNTNIGLSAATGNGHIGAFTVTNSTTVPSVAHITFTPQVNGCIGTPVTMKIVDNPIPTLSSTTTPPAICDSTLFSYLPTSPIADSTVFTWSRAPIYGIRNAGATGSNNPNEYLDDTTNVAIPVVYVDTLKAYGCMSIYTVTVSVNPSTKLTTPLSIPALCNSTVFNYVPAATAPGTTFAWSRATTANISNPGASGVGNPAETLVNTSNLPVGVTYHYTLDINGCAYNQNVTTTINPTPVLTSPTVNAPQCDSLLFTYMPASNVAVTTFSWSRASIAGITNPAASGTGGQSETLVNTLPTPVNVIYVDTLKAYGCVYTQNVSVIVKPKPTLSSDHNPDSLCNRTLFSYMPAGPTGGTVFNWVRIANANIDNPVAAGLGMINESLNNITPNPVPVKYAFSLTANGCLNLDTVTVVINPSPVLSNPHANQTCDSSVFTFIPASATAGTSYSWTRAYVSGIANIAASGTGNPNELLKNNTYINVALTYVYTLTANGCSSTDSISVVVHPTPRLSSVISHTVCSSAPFNYAPTSFTPGATFAWSRAAVAGITPATNTGINVISESLTNAGSTALNVVYVYTVTANACPHSENIYLKVNPAPALPGIDTKPAASLCGSTYYQNFGTSTAPPAGVSYYWTAANAQVWSTGANGQYALVNFTNPGDATVTLNVVNGATSCLANNSYTVNVSNASIGVPEVGYFEGQLVCKETDVDSYQWGYDDKATLDSVAFDGATNQNFALPVVDITNKLYWVMITRGGCSQKAYFNAPTGVTDINAAVAGVKLYPNPANDYINVEVNTDLAGNEEIEVVNMMGQRIEKVAANDHKAKINVSALPSGCYLVECTRNGVKIASSRFIKN